jgi:hypothetical protein
MHTKCNAIISDSQAPLANPDREKKDKLIALTIQTLNRLNHGGLYFERSIAPLLN